jgi:hypothetical protein
MAVRLATISAESRYILDPSMGVTVSVGDMAWGSAWALWSGNCMAIDAGDAISDTKAGATWGKIKGYLRRNQGRVSYRKLSRYMKLNVKDLKESLGGMQEAGMVRITDDAAQGGRAGKTVFLLDEEA